MNKKQATILMQKAVKAFNEGNPDFQSIMDDASVRFNDEQWLELERRIDEARKTPFVESPEQEQARLEANVARLREELHEAETQLNSFYGRKYSKGVRP